MQKNTKMWDLYLLVVNHRILEIFVMTRIVISPYEKLSFWLPSKELLVYQTQITCKIGIRLFIWVNFVIYILN